MSFPKADLEHLKDSRTVKCENLVENCGSVIVDVDKEKNYKSFEGGFLE